ncbi:MAG: recombinase family protein [Candidatus Levybacteria bacterium]|nr:recombinase family protein [Candidatus Levybacteria bacterium]MBP9815418.1 recombinase family protein [Candidatus Levybacteria bacterium]
MNNEETQLKVALYLRVSTEDQVEKYGLDAQRAAIEGIIKSRGTLKDGKTPAVVLAGKAYEYIDDGISGTKNVNERPAFARLKEDILNSEGGQRPFDTVAVFKIDRFARKLSILVDIIDFFTAKKIEFLSATEAIDTSSPFGRAMLGIMGVIAELELENIKDRTQRGRNVAKEQGKHMGGQVKYGYQTDDKGFHIPLKEEAEIVKRIFSWFTIDKLTPQVIADKLAELGVLSPSASALKYKKVKNLRKKRNSLAFWRAERIRDILSDEIYTGIFYYGKYKGNVKQPKSEWTLSPKRHQAIILKHIFEFAQHRLEEISARKTLTKKKEEGDIYLLSGLLKCNACKKLSGNTEMMSWTGARKILNKSPLQYSHYYYCNRKNTKKFTFICPTVPIPAEQLEEYIVDFVKRLLENPTAVYEYQRRQAASQMSIKQLEDDKRRYEELLNDLPNRIQSYKEQHMEKIINIEELKNGISECQNKKTEYENRINEIDYQLSQIALSRGYEESLKLYSERYGNSLYKALLDKKTLYELVHMLVNQIVVYSRPVKRGDRIAGRKKEGQLIPERIDIQLNLPQTLLKELYSLKFGVRNDNL